jgi:hypothetical protein
MDAPHRMRLFPVAFSFTTLLVSAVVANGQTLVLDHCSCVDGGVPSDSTFTFRGRVSAWNGAPTFRIWRVGTNRIVGLRNICLKEMDLGAWNPYMGTELWADFTVSAVTPQRPGVMQFVCLRSIARPFLRKDPEVGP